MSCAKGFLGEFEKVKIMFSVLMSNFELLGDKNQLLYTYIYFNPPKCLATCFAYFTFLLSNY